MIESFIGTDRLSISQAGKVIAKAAFARFGLGFGIK